MVSMIFFGGQFDYVRGVVEARVAAECRDDSRPGVVLESSLEPGVKLLLLFDGRCLASVVVSHWPKVVEVFVVRVGVNHVVVLSVQGSPTATASLKHTRRTWL